MPTTVKYSRFEAPSPVPPEFDLELPDGNTMFNVEIENGKLYIGCIYPSDRPLKKVTITLLKDGDEFEADHVATLGVVDTDKLYPDGGGTMLTNEMRPLVQGNRHVVILGILPPAVKAAMELQKAGIVAATRLPPGLRGS